MTENKNEKKVSTYNAKSQAEYRKKVKQYNVKYSLSEIDLLEVAKIENAILKSGLTANAWIKTAIHEKLEKDGFIK